MLLQLVFLLTGTALVRYLQRYLVERKANPRGLPRPPGPKGYPLIGALFEQPLQNSWLTYDNWFKRYGDMVYFEVLGQPFLVLGSLRRTGDLFDKRSSKYSDRPPTPMTVEHMKFDYALAALPYGYSWRRHRRAFRQHFNPGQVPKYDGTQIKEARMFLRRLLNAPDEFAHHIHHLIAAIIMKVSYGITVQETDDPYIFRAQEANKGFTDAGVTGRYLVNTFPAMKYIPSWFPGTGWKKTAKYYAGINQLVSVKPFEFVKQKIAEGTASPSVASALINGLPAKRNPNREDEENVARNVAAVSYLAGEDTLASTFLSFFLVMCLYPEAQKRAQAELDHVLNGRLPEFSDKSSLPYTNALLHELNRWHLVLPSAIPHYTSEDDEYDGYFIPKGTIVMGNSWSILRDPDVYSNPDSFMPERFLKDGQLDPNAQYPSVAAFGFGRRVCPGQYMSDSTIFIVIASVLSNFDIRPPLGDDGKPVQLQPRFGGDLSAHPLPFEARIQPRSSKVVEMIRNLDLSGL